MVKRIAQLGPWRRAVMPVRHRTAHEALLRAELGRLMAEHQVSATAAYAMFVRASIAA
jgi:hypothetical protein